jgi:hypothetical protein
MNLVIHRGQPFSQFKGTYIPTTEALAIMYRALKEGKAKKIIDTEDTLGFIIG